MDEEEQQYHRRRSKRKKVEVKRLGVTTDLEKIDRGIEIEEQRAWEKKQQKLKENFEKFKLELSLAPPTHGSEQITYVTGTGKKQTEDEVTSLPISKELMSQSYAKAMTTGLEMTFFHIGAKLEDEDNERFMKQHFVLQQGHDYLVVPLVPQGGGSYRREGKGPTFDELAEKADAAAQWLLENYGNVYKRLSQALRRVARDINNLAGGRPSKVSYPLDLTMGAGGLASFAAVIRADKGRVTKATKYIESILKSGKKSFAKRFGGKNPKYVGTGATRT